MNILDKCWLSVTMVVGLSSNFVAFGPSFTAGTIMLMSSFGSLAMWALWRA